MAADYDWPLIILTVFLIRWRLILLNSLMHLFRNLVLIVIILSTVQFTSCKSSDKKSIDVIKKEPHGITYEINLDHDTINLTDNDGLKQGKWIKYTAINIVDKLKKMEEGCYLNGKKEGYWKFYLPDGQLKDSILYKNDNIGR